MGLHDRELSPLSSNDIGDKTHRRVNDVPNHFNKTMKRSVTDTIRDQLDDESEIPNVSVQKPAYIPGKSLKPLTINTNLMLFDCS